MFEFRNNEKKRLISLVKESKSAMERLNELLNLGKNIYKNIELCRKMEF